jgi:DnaJ homologue, subfamily C, member 28, conserved domain
MFPGFEKIVEERIKKAQRQGDFKNLAGSGKPLVFEDDSHVPEDLRLAYKVLKNADFVPPEIELKKEINRTQDLLEGMTDTTQKYNALTKLNFLIMKVNTIRSGRIDFEVPQKYASKVVDKIETPQSE